MKQSELASDEQYIEDRLDQNKLHAPQDKLLIEAKLHGAAKNYFKKDAKINIRISSTDLYRLKRLASREGIPYQTMISGILHKVANGLDIVDHNE